MNIRKSSKKWLTTIAALCSSVFLFAACEPGDDRPAEAPQDQEAPTYGEPDREQQPTTEDPGMGDTGTDDQWEDDGSGSSEMDSGSEPGTGTGDETSTGTGQ